MSQSNVQRSRFAPAVPGGKDALSYYMAIAIAAAVGATGWLAIVAFKPLERAQIDPIARVADVPSVVPRALAAAERQRLVDALTAQNYFAFGRGEWASPTQLASATTTEPAPKPRPAAKVIAGDSRVINSRGEVMNVVEKEDLSNELQRAIENLKLRGIFASASGTPYAMITRMHEEQASHSTSYRAGDEFVEQKAGGDPWRVELVDIEAKRAALSRSGQTVWLNLRERSFAAALARAGGSNRVFDPATSVPVVEQLTQGELRARLIEAGLTAREADELFALAAEQDAPPPDPRVRSLANAAKNVGTPSGEGDPDASSSEPAGIEALLEMMATNTPPTREMMERFNNPQPEAEKNDDPDPEKEPQ